jgi:hypothetical protein
MQQPETITTETTKDLDNSPLMQLILEVILAEIIK